MIVRDLCVGLTERIDVSTSGEPANGAVDTSIFNLGGAKGRFAVFASQASNLDGADSGTGLDVFLRDRAAQNTAPKAVSLIAIHQHGHPRPGQNPFSYHLRLHANLNILPNQSGNKTADPFGVRVYLERNALVGLCLQLR